MEDYKEDIFIEYEELNTRRQKLAYFLDTEELPQEERNALLRKYDAMNTYENILVEMIGNILNE